MAGARTRSGVALPLVGLALQLVAGGAAAGETPAIEDWMPLIRAGSHAEAEQLCRGWLEERSPAYRVEAHKCLANVALSNAAQIRIERTGERQVELRDAGVSASAIDAALAHLESGLELAPQDLGIHQGRLHVLLMARRYDRAVTALENSVATYRGEDALDAWIAYSQRFFDAGRLEDGLAFLAVLEASYPEDHRVVANIGAFLGLLERDDAALRYSRRAVELAPDDPLNNWNLGRLHDYTGEPELADRYYGKALRLAKAEGNASVYACLYADFVEEKLRDPGRACRLRQESCPEDFSAKCVPAQKPAARDTSQ